VTDDILEQRLFARAGTKAGLRRRRVFERGPNLIRSANPGIEEIQNNTIAATTVRREANDRLAKDEAG
jgi:hypothetical protein